MRNLKKFLALVLAMMMVFGLMVTANAASVDDYTDGDEVNEDYRQAMEVITTLGVLQGDGTLLYPKGTLKRNELAAVLYRLYTGNNNVKDEKTGRSPEDDDVILQFMKNADSYKDVEVGQWYTGYINYATDRGWLNGYGEYFGPNDTLTTIQMLKGVLCMLDVPLATTGDWQMNTLKAAQEINIIDDFTPEQLSGYATREMVAQIALNALDYKPDNDETGAYVIVLTAAGKAAYAATTPTIVTNRAFLALEGAVFESRAEAVLNATLITQDGDPSHVARPGVHYDIVEEVTVNNTLGSKSFGLTKATYGTGGKDAYGRPMTVYKKDNVVISELPIDPVIERSEPITGVELYELGVNAAIELRQASAVDLTSYGYDLLRYTVRNNAIDRTPYGGNGVSVEIYKIATDSYVAVVLAPVFAQVTDIKSVRKTATEGAYTEYDLDITTTDSLRIYSSTVTKNDVTNVRVNGTVDEDDYVIVTTEKEFDSKGNVVTSYVITPVTTITGTISRYTSSSDSFTINGKSYPASAIPGTQAGSNGSVMAAVGDGETHLIALDDDNNVVAVVDDTAVISNSFIFALHDEQIIKINGNIGTNAWAVTGIDKNGNLVTLEVTSIRSFSGVYLTGEQIDDASGNDVGRGLYRADKQPDGTYHLVYATSGSANVYLTNTSAGAAGGNTFTINNGPALIASTVYATANTKYYVAVKENGKYTGVTAYVGYEAIGNINSNLSGKAIAAIDADKDGIAEIVFIDSYNTSVNGYAYVLDEYYVDEAGDYYYTAFINGGWDTLKLVSPITDALPALMIVSGGTTNLVQPSDPNSTTKTMNSSTYTYDSGLIIENLVSGGTNIIASNVGKEVPLYIINGDDVKVTTAEKLKKDGGAVVVFARDGSNNIAAIFIHEDAMGYGIADASINTVAKFKELPDGVYTPGASFATDLTGVSPGNVRVFKYTAHQKEKYTLNIYNANGALVYVEEGSVERSKKGEAGMFYISLNPMGGNAGSRKGTWSGASNAPNGNYTYEVVGQTSNLVVSSGSFTK